MSESTSSTNQSSSNKLGKITNNSLLAAQKRAIKARNKADFGHASSSYEFGGWKSLFENSIKLPKSSSQSSSSIKLTKTNHHQNINPKHNKKNLKNLLCPSSQLDRENALIFGVVEGTVESPSVAYLEKLEPIEKTIQQLSTAINTTEMLRISSPCIEKKCLNFDGKNCRLATRIVEQLSEVTETLPACQIRSQCRWWQQEGKSACLRCPQIVRDNYYYSPLIEQVGIPSKD